MSKQHELFVGQKFRKSLQGHTTELEIVALSAHEVTLKASGDFVANADKPRIIPINRFVSWEGQTPNVE